MTDLTISDAPQPPNPFWDLILLMILGAMAILTIANLK